MYGMKLRAHNRHKKIVLCSPLSGAQYHREKLFSESYAFKKIVLDALSMVIEISLTLAIENFIVNRA
jgi:hypothetical protein